MSESKWRRWARLRGANPRADVEDEFAFHMEERIEALMARGMSLEAARARAREQFGDLRGAAAICTGIGERRADRARWSERFSSVAQDLRYAAKSMRRAPGFTLATVLTIALGIGANTVVFSLLNALLFQPLDAARPGELVRVYTSESIVRDDRDRFGGSSFADFTDLRRSGVLADLAAFVPFGATVVRDGVASRHEARVVSDNYFALIGRPLSRGGWSAQPSDVEVIVSHEFWRTALGAEPSAIGTAISINGRTMRVAGITAENFTGVEPARVMLYLPMSAMPALAARPGFLTERGERSLRMLGRMLPGATAASVERELGARMKALAESYPATNAGRQVAVRRAHSVIATELTGALYPVATLVFAATVIMMLIAGVNVAAVLLSRTVRRRREIAVRLSLGASRVRIARQLLTESLLLAGVSSVIVIGLVVSLPMVAASLGLPESVHPSVDVRVLGYALAVAAAAGILFGIAPALAGTRADVVEALRVAGGDNRRSASRTQRGLVVAQLAMSMILLVVGAALLLSLDKQQRVDPGFRPQNLLVALFEDPMNQANRERERAFTRLLVERFATIPGVRSFTVASMAPLSGDGFSSTIHIPGYEPAPNEDMDVPTITGGPDLFRTLGVPILRGRELTWADRDTTPKVIVNESMAKRYWPGREAVGSFVALGGRGGTQAQVIAVAGDARFYSLSESPRPMVAIQRALEGGGTVLIRSSDDPARLIPAVRGTMARNENPLTLAQLSTMEEVLRTSLLISRVISTVILGIGVVAILLASVGLYGVVSYATAGRSREFGIRMALGATRESITRLVVGYGLRLAATGGVIGLLLGVLATRLMGSLLFGESSAAIAIVVVSAILGAITLAASLVPARRATAIAPAAALRSE